MSEQTEEEYLIERLSKLLAEISVIVNGPQPMGVLWSYADLPQKVQALKDAAALNAQQGVVEAARRYYEGWCQDEASDEPEDGSDRCRWTGCTVEQRDAARALRDAIAAMRGATP